MILTIYYIIILLLILIIFLTYKYLTIFLRYLKRIENCVKGLEKNINNIEITKDKYVDINYDILKKYGIKINFNDNNKFYNCIKKEKLEIDNYKAEISRYRDKHIDDINIDEILDYKMKKEGINKKRKIKLKRKIIRYIYLYELYCDKLHYVEFSIIKIRDMPDNDWIELTIELDNIINRIL